MTNLPLPLGEYHLLGLINFQSLMRSHFNVSRDDEVLYSHETFRIRFMDRAYV